MSGFCGKGKPLVAANHNSRVIAAICRHLAELLGIEVGIADM